MKYFNGFSENTVISFQKDGTSPIILYSQNRLNELTLERLENDLINHGIEKILQLLPENILPSITQNISRNDPSNIFNETILTWNPNLILILDKSTQVFGSNRSDLFQREEFWKLVPKILSEKKSDLYDIFKENSEIYSLLSNYMGFYGYLSYEAGRHLESFEIRDNKEIIPTSILSFPLNYIIERKEDFLYIELKGLVIGFEIRIALPFPRSDYIASSVDFETYINKIDSIKDYIIAGDIYQANFTHRLVISKDKIQKNSRDIYFDLLKKNPVRHAAYLEYIDLNILSISPELFLSIKNGKVLTKPIKGTRPRGNDNQSDQKMINELINSDKDQAELAMIVDLLRNDLGKSAKPGSVEVEKHAAIESYSNVHHLVSSITADIDQDVQSSWRLFLRAFPGGSITGCPKIRAMEIIEELETHPRGVYTGSIGYIAINGNLQFNIAIRTISMTQDVMAFNVGGGIVFDSDPTEEYIESLHKATHIASHFGKNFTGNIAWLDGKFIFADEIEKHNFQYSTEGFFETILIKNSEVQHLDQHRNRMKKGSIHYGIDPILPSLETINTLVKINLAQDARLKLSIIIKSGITHSLLEIQSYVISVEPKELIIQETPFNYSLFVNDGIKPLDYNNYRHSTEVALEKGYWDSVLIDDESNILETGRANLYFYIDKWYTPSKNCVQGLIRKKLLSHKLVEKKQLNTQELSQAKAIGISNSLIGILPITKIVTESNDVIWNKSEKQMQEYFKLLEID